MPNLRDIKKRIASVKGTQKLTRAMKLVAAVKLRKAQDNLFKLRPYAKKLIETAAIIATRLQEEDHPLLAKREVRRKLVWILTSDRGMCGSFNANIIKNAEAELKEHADQNSIIAVAGKKGIIYFNSKKIKIDREFSGIYDDYSYETASKIAAWFINEFLNKNVDSVKVIYNEFKTAITQRVITEEILPVQPTILEPSMQNADFIFEPAKIEFLDKLLQMYVATEVHRVILESIASEQGARMTAMENATNNAEEMIKNLTLEYNKARQSAITKELLEIIGGTEAQRLNR